MSKHSKRNYPGDVRIPGTKDYALILGNLISYSNKLTIENRADEAIKLTLKVAEKLQELGFKKAAKSTQTKAKNIKNILSKKELVIELAINKWKEGKEINDLAKEENRLNMKEDND